MLNTSHGLARVPQSLPFEEVLPWHKFATLAGGFHKTTQARTVGVRIDRNISS